MKVAVVSTIRNFSWGAPGECMAALVEALLDAGHEVLAVVAPMDLVHERAEQLRKRGARIEALPEPQPRFVRLARPRAALAGLRRASLLRVVQQFGADFVYLNQGGTWCGLMDDFNEVVRSFEGRYALICHLNRPEIAFASTQLQRARHLMSCARRVFFNSSWTHELAQLQIAAPIPNFSYFQLPIRFTFDAPLPWPKAARPKLAMVNRLDAHHKGIDLALQAVATLRGEGHELSLAIYGTGPDEEYVRELCRFLGVEDCVTLHGHVADVRDIWRDNEMLFLPSRFEGLAVAMVEAMGFGRPVLRTPFGGAREWIVEGRTGYLCDAAEAASVTDALRRAIARRADWPAMGRAAHDHATRQLDRAPARIFLEALELVS